MPAFDSCWTFAVVRVNGTATLTDNHHYETLMKNGLRMALALMCGVAVLPLTVTAQTNAPGAAPAPALDPKAAKEKISYSIGKDIGRNLLRGGVDLDMDVISAAMKDAVEGKPSKLTDAEVAEGIRMYQTEARAKHEEQMKKAAEKNHVAGEAFLAANKSKPGVKTKVVTLPDGKTAELQYKVITEGAGAVPGANDVVTVNYKGTLIDGKEFDNSAKRGQPFKTPLNRVVRGWTEALSMMKAGSKWEVYLPSSLAYGDQGYGAAIEPGSTLIFEIELVGTDTPPPPAPAQPLTSDIIKVPSAEELKKGAKIEVIKAEDLEKMTNKPVKP